MLKRYIIHPMEHQANRLPYQGFEKLGMSKKDVLNLPADDLKSLLQGRTTKMLELNIKAEGVDLKEKAKISLYTLADNSVGIKVHPFRKELSNEFNLTSKELDRLKTGEAFAKQQISLNGEREKYLFQLDRDINEIKKIRVQDISIPNSIQGAKLNQTQKQDLLEGKSIVIDTEKNTKSIRIDLTQPSGYSIQQTPAIEESSALTKERVVEKNKEESRNLGMEVEQSAKKILAASPERTSGMPRVHGGPNGIHR